MTDWIPDPDEIGPERVLHVHDPETRMHGVVVVDSLALGDAAAGGLRMLPDVTTAEIRLLARAMTYKYCALDVPIGGAKSGLRADPSWTGEQRAAALRAFGRAVRPLLETGVIVGADIGTDMHDVATVYDAAGVPPGFSGLSSELRDGEPLENHATGYGVVVAAREACAFAGRELAGARVAIEGFGKVGGGAARYFHEAGARVVALSNVDGTAWRADGLDVPALLDARRAAGDAALQACPEAELLPREALFALEVDVLVPGARPHVIDAAVAERVQARAIAPIANVPLTEEAEARLHQRGVHVVPDFVANAGGVLIGAIDLLGGSADDLFRVLEEQIGRMTRASLAEAREARLPPRVLAVRQARAKVLAARSRAGRPTLAEILETGRKRLGL